ncbi:rho GTPase-activating protein 3 isoform X2 [Hevea brasiliensis]|uniref:rho GTPase-activating protein 3 isoform X2 n=1 Tax=Hevea brasiliensis TaxID=3981 RepID=UPI0025E9551F|nr:rho GTPase-activating protein 3 isoform X2 [Hevea brasiliensis]
MTLLFRSKSCGFVGFTEFNPVPPPSPFLEDDENDDEEEEGQEYEDDEYNGALRNPISTPFISSGSTFGERGGGGGNQRGRHGSNQFAILDILAAALRKSVVTCSVESEDVISSMDISWPTDVRHVSHVTFDSFNGFLGLPTEFEPDVPRKVPSASANVFGVSAKSMQCTYDDKGNIVPTILLMMQKRLYVEGGLKAEGIFRINAENSHEEYVRDRLNEGIVPRGIDVHCLAGLIKAWFRELPSGVLDSLTAEQVMHCNTEDDCTQLVKLLPPAEVALLDWLINLMADVVEHEQYNKMNARNIAMVFAPNMTQMADPLTALVHVVQVMNLLKTLILKNLREREESAVKTRLLSACLDYPGDKSEPCQTNLNCKPCKIFLDGCAPEVPTTGSSPSFSCEMGALDSGCKGEYDNGDWLNLRKGVRRLCRHPVFQLSKPAKKSKGLSAVNNRRGGEVWT